MEKNNMEKEDLTYFYKFDEDITTESVQHLIDTIHPFEDVVLYFSTTGGDVGSMQMLVDFLNSRPKVVEVAFDFQVISAGFLLLLSIDCDYYFTQGFEFCMLHKIDAVTYNLRDIKFNRYRVKLLKKYNSRVRKKLKELGLSKKKLKVFDKGEDLFLYKKDLKKIGLWVE